MIIFFSLFAKALKKIKADFTHEASSFAGELLRELWVRSPLEGNLYTHGTPQTAVPPP